MLPRHRGYPNRAVQSPHPDTGTLYLRTPRDLTGAVEDAWAHCLDRPLCGVCRHVLRVVEAEIRERQRQPYGREPDDRELARRLQVHAHLAATHQQRDAGVPS